MKVSVIINQKAGGVNEALLKSKISDALFRCDLDFFSPKDLIDLDLYLSRQIIDEKTDYLMLCGGDGTLNVSIQPLMRLRDRGFSIPPVCIVRSGTANDLASEMGISQRVSSAARAILEGEVKTIDIIEIKDENEKICYMLTNGGVGLAAETAARANELRKLLRTSMENTDPNSLLGQASKISHNLVRKAGSSIYGLLLGERMLNWTDQDWEIEIKDRHHNFTTKAPFILINNQQVTGRIFKTGPLTNNSDGSFNVLVVHGKNILEQTAAISNIVRGKLLPDSENPNFETDQLKIIAKGKHKLKYFGDGEILFPDSQELNFRCIHPGLPVVINRLF